MPPVVDHYFRYLTCPMTKKLHFLVSNEESYAQDEKGARSDKYILLDE